MAFDYFRNQKVDIAIIETGLGGRLDSTNILSPIMSIITNISFDHMDMLGNTLDKIAYEKAGIIKKNIPVIIGNHSNQKEVFLKKAASCNSNISFANEEISSSSLETDLLGDYQCENLVTVECAINKLRTLGWKLNPESINNGLLAVAKNTHLQGRWQILSEKPKIILETAHNKEGLIAALTQLKSLKYRQLHLVIGFVKDKDIDEILALFPKHATYYFCQAKIPRSLDVTDLKNKAAHHELRGNAFLTVELALKAAKENTLSTDIIYVGGSNFIVAEAL